ncbi:transmembrane protein 233 [Acanthochromis polyacanthus]|uniref:transmembrane protein 233 n=1 Tax=Acanthochromis polyacanthus TaxID=80966 RepID=UPI000B8F33F9|nr:transmembrane protein 233 [Acanthochromis polyacanthus]
MDAKPSADGSSDFVKNEEAQEIPPMRNYLCLTMFTCFCPAWPINIVALVFSVMAQRSYHEEDYEGSRRLGRKALHLGIVSFVLGLAIITSYTIVHFTTHVV